MEIFILLISIFILQGLAISVNNWIIITNKKFIINPKNYKMQFNCDTSYFSKIELPNKIINKNA